jgi:hypothetical protein
MDKKRQERPEGTLKESAHTNTMHYHAKRLLRPSDLKIIHNLLRFGFSTSDLRLNTGWQ